MDLAHAKSGNYGPARDLPIKWPWSHRIAIKPGHKVVYRFSFNAWFENAVIVYSYPQLDELAARGNYSRSQDDYEFVNRGDVEVEHVITGWHKPSPPDAHEPWLHSPKYVHPGTPVVDIIGFADDQGRENQNPRDPNGYRNALVSVVYD
jgi:hypothetical protein